MMKLQQADISMRTMVSVRDKVVDAYQTIMNMTI
jgi:flagellar hook-basal body complex protein FliE